MDLELPWYVWGLIGLFFGWALQMLIDRLYWQNARVCSDLEASLQSTIGRLEQQNGSLTADIGRMQTQNERVGKLEADLDARTAQYNGLLADVDQRKQRENALTRELQSREAEVKTARPLRTRVQELESAIAERDAALAKVRTSYESRGAQLSGLTAKVSDLESELSLRNREADQLSAEISTLSAAASASTAAALTTPSNAIAANPVYQDAPVRPAPVALDEEDTHVPPQARITAAPTSSTQTTDLGMIWGINGEVNNQLHANGIYNYEQLANSRANDVDSALTAASRYYPGMDKQAIHGSWIKQSDLAIAGQWDDLSNYQHEAIDLASGRDDLKVIWGVGPKIEGVMNENGIYTFAQVSAVPAERLTEILHKAGPRFRISSEKLHETWPEQARLADQGDTDALAALQATLSNRTA